MLYKPYLYLSQFTREHPDHLCLSDLTYTFPKDVYPVGRLDKDSEGLLILTNDGKLNKQLLDPKHEHQRTYWVQVEGNPPQEALQMLRAGVTIRVGKRDYLTKPAMAKILDHSKAKQLPDRDPPIRFRKNIPTTWLAITLTEGKNRQVRKMCAKVGFPVLRLVRVGIEKLHGLDLQPGDVKTLDRKKLFHLLGLNKSK